MEWNIPILCFVFLGAKLKSSLEESVEPSSSPVIQLDEDVPEPWRSVIRDLSSKVDTLKMKRQDDRMRVKEGERNKLQVIYCCVSSGIY